MSNSDNQLGLIAGQGWAAQRLADALLHSLGGVQIILRIATPSTGDNSSQLGLEAPSSVDLDIYPAVIKNLPSETPGKRRIEATLSSRSLKSIAKDYGIEDMVAWLLSAQGLFYHGQVMAIESVVVDSFLGADCLYHVTATE